MTRFTVLFIILILFICWHFGILHKKPEKAGNIAVSLGVFGTFLGILVALNNFNFDDTESLKNNLMGLIEGLRFAFVSSVAGMGANLFLKIFISKEAPADEDKSAYYLSILPQLYEVVKDMNLLMPHSPNYTAPPVLTEMVGELKAIKELHKIEMGMPGVSMETATPDLGTALSLSSWLKEELGESFKSIRRDLALIVESINDHPTQLNALNTELDTLTTTLQNLFAHLKTIESEKVPATHLESLSDLLSGTVGHATQLQKLLDTLDALLLSIIEHNAQLDSTKYKRALYKGEFV